MSRLLVRAHTLLTQSQRHAAVMDGALLVEDGVIRRVGPLAELEQAGPFDVVIGDPRRHLALPGFVNGHHHSLRPARVGLPAAPLEPWVLRSRLRALPPLTPDELYDHTLWGTLQFLKSGVTSVVDHFPADPRLDDFGLADSIRAYVDAGVRAAVCVACMDQQHLAYEDDATFLGRLPQDLADDLRPRVRPLDHDAFFAAWERLAARFDGQPERIRLGFGPGGPQWCSDTLLRRIRRVADEHDAAPVQIHLLESRHQARYSQRAYPRGVVQHLVDLGFFGAATSCAHGVWLGGAEARLLAATGAVVVHNPSSNLLLFNGIAPVGELLASGVRVGFGLDAAGLNDTMDLLTDLRLAMLLQRGAGPGAQPVTPADLLGMATHGGAAALGMGTSLGRLEEGYQADVVLLDRTALYASPYVSPAAPPEEVVLRRATADLVRHVLVGGRPVIQDGRPPGIDEAALRARVARSVQRVYAAAPAPDTLFERLAPHLTSFYGEWDEEPIAAWQARP
jgi:5-methylthioadenosine/S-adenosylhomocysteine deaminase